MRRGTEPDPAVPSPSKTNINGRLRGGCRASWVPHHMVSSYPMSGFVTTTACELKKRGYTCRTGSGLVCEVFQASWETEIDYKDDLSVVLNRGSQVEDEPRPPCRTLVRPTFVSVAGGSSRRADQTRRPERLRTGRGGASVQNLRPNMGMKKRAT